MKVFLVAVVMAWASWSAALAGDWSGRYTGAKGDEGGKTSILFAMGQVEGVWRVQGVTSFQGPSSVQGPTEFWGTYVTGIGGGEDGQVKFNFVDALGNGGTLDLIRKDGKWKAKFNVTTVKETRTLVQYRNVDLMKE